MKVIEPRQPGPLARGREAWSYRRLVPFFGKRLLEKLYRKTWLGWWWIPLRPVMATGGALFLFGGVLNVGSEGVPYVIYLLVGLGAWELFAQAAMWATRSLELNRKYLGRVYLPRLVVLVSSLSIPLVFLGLYWIMAAIAIGYYVVSSGTLYLELSPQLALGAAGLALAAALALALGLFLSIYGAQARDVRFTLAFALGFWAMVTPVLYSYDSMPAGYRTVAEFNPMTAPIQLVKKGILGVGEVPTLSLATTLGTLAVLGTLGLWFFAKSEAAALDSL